MEYIEVTEDDIATADRLCAQVLGRDGEELPPRTRALLAHIRRLVAAECARLGMKASDYRFTRRQVREHSGFGHTQLKVHLRRLEELEYLIPHRAPLPGGGQRIVYKLDPPPPEAPEAESDPFRGRGRGQGRRAGVGRIGTPPDVNGEVGEANARSGGAGRAGRESASAGTDHEVASYPQPPEPPPESEAAALASATSGKERD